METATPKRVTFRDLLEEAKKRVLILSICVVGLSYLMSLTSSSVLVNLPAAVSLIILLRYFAWEFEMQRKAAAYNSKLASSNTITPKKLPEPPKVAERPDWKKKVNSPAVEGAIDHFTRHLVSEWVTDLWYSKLTPDGQGPEELVQIINGVLGEFSARLRNINLIDLLTRDLINLICNHLEHFRAIQVKIEKQQPQVPTIEYLDVEIRRLLAAENRLHPALFSTEAENKVLQHLVDGLISYTFTREDLECSFFRYIVRELLACAVMRPILKLANPRFLNERIESVVISAIKAKGDAAAEDASQSKPNDSSRTPSDHFSRFLDSSVTGVELVPLKANKANGAADNLNGTNLSKDPLLSMDTRSSSSGGEWGDVLDIIARRKTAVLAPENFENMWTKGRYYKKKEDKIRVHHLSSKEKKTLVEENSKVITNSREENSKVEHSSAVSSISYQEESEHNLSFLDEVELESSGSYTSEDEEIGNITGLDSPVKKVWDGKSNRNVIVTSIHHPLENPKRTHVQYKRLVKTPSVRKRSRPSTQRSPVWQEVERSSFLSGDGQDILSALKADDSTDDSETEIFRGAAASSAASFTVNPMQNSLISDSFYKLRCEVLGANIVKSGSKFFAVYAISVTDVNDNSWSIKRRLRIVGALQYLTITRADICHAVNKVSQYLQAPTIAHLRQVKRILRYIKGTIQFGLHFTSQSTTSLTGFCDADWAGCPETRRSTTGYCIFLGANCISWSSKKQPTVAKSTAESEYRAMASTTAELVWITYLLRDIGISLPSPPQLFSDNISALHMSVNPVFHARTKHIELDYHFVREKVAIGTLITRYVPSSSQNADILTKPLLKHQFKILRSKLGVVKIPLQLEGGCEDYQSKEVEKESHANGYNNKCSNGSQRLCATATNQEGKIHATAMAAKGKIGNSIRFGKKLLVRARARIVSVLLFELGSNRAH